MIFFHQLSRAWRDIKRREWLLLALEFVTVLAGIIIAFQLNEWASSRKDKAHQQQVIERLFDDARLNVALFRRARDQTKKQMDREERFALQITRGQCPAQQDWWSAVTVNFYPSMEAQTSVYEELMGSGGLSSIQDEKARNAVSDFHAALKWVNMQNEAFRLSKEAPPFRLRDPRVTVIYEPKADEPLNITVDRDAFCSDKSFRNGLADAVRDHRFVYAYRRDLTVYAIEMCSALGRTLGRPCIPTRGGPLRGADAEAAKLPAKSG
jgi:hypothetical protein